MAFFSSIASKLAPKDDNYNNYSGGDYSIDRPGSFINDSQTESTVATKLLGRYTNGQNLSLQGLVDNKNHIIPQNNSVAINTEANGYVIPIDYTEFGEVPDAFLNTLNKYKQPESIAVNTDSFYLDSNKKLKQVYSSTYVVPSLFNPYVGVKSRGMNTNQPLQDTAVDSENRLKPYKPDSGDCSIWRLLQMSTQSGGKHQLGGSVYKLADFMYCKDLGKVSNNHLITLRRYAVPVGDNIYTSANTGDEDVRYSCTPDIAHMVTWFGTDDNKLSNIIKMSFHASWREMNAEIQQVQSQADSSGTGVLGMIANTLNPTYNKAMGAGITGNHNLVSWLGSKLNLGGVNFGNPGQYQNNEALTNYDKHKIYEPKNTIQSNHYYEGKILFEHEFSLVFSYKIRAYENISQKAAMQDLIHNILATTFTRGKFWGGSVKMIGAPGNNSSLKKMNAFIDNTWDKLAGFAENVLTGNVNWQELMASLSDAAGQLMNSAKDAAKNLMDNPKEVAQQFGQTVVDFWKNHDFSSAVKGALKNTLGRPAMYAINSYVSGENLGLWHVTIGNPLNPIMVIGNLILTNCEVSFGDCPLGLEDFPTELRCTVTLKHCKPRDMTDISRMFTRGESTIAVPLGQGGWTNYYKKNTMLQNVSKDTYNESSYQQTFGTSHGPSISNNFATLT